MFDWQVIPGKSKSTSIEYTFGWHDPREPIHRFTKSPYAPLSPYEVALVKLEDTSKWWEFWK